MKSKLFQYSIATLVLSAATGSMNLSSALAGRQNFTIVNRTSSDIINLYVSPVNTNSWEEDVFGSDYLPSGNQIEVNFGNSTQGCYYDLKAVLRNGSIGEGRSLNLCQLEKYTFTD
ncbi:hypothetical protein [Chamaesiphon sp. GL140_3_metabinner_50]|uniref:hypothetical protein n=1 Tax=Chamaesiphon sp. GL140_3_metabinner_50 TaxID=2970812 RepID=UPI0025D842C9|nr:hypothetical protein [Chamaesiphon sp. GL140_3_metabinner_50]